MKIIVHAPEGGRPPAPVAAPAPLHRLDQTRMIGLLDMDSGQSKPVQIDTRGRLCWLEDSLEEDQVRTYKIDGSGNLAEADRVVVHEGESETEIKQAGKLVASFHHGPELPKPYLDPICDPSGAAVTHDASKGSDQHPHQRSCWVGWGNVDGVDHWSEQSGCGRQVVRRFTVSSSGPVYARLGMMVDWLGSDGKRQLVEHRSYTFFAAHQGGPRMIDLAVRFNMTEKNITIGDTKDGGICAVRVARGLDVQSGGTIRNAEGEEGEEACWGARASWCDYSGEVAGLKSGITLMDYPGNLRHPTHWNVRDYGLMSANPFGLAEFLNSEAITAERTWQQGDTHCFRYRILLHAGFPGQEQMDRFYRTFAKPMKIDID